jgi:hypothetical protein
MMAGFVAVLITGDAVGEVAAEHHLGEGVVALGGLTEPGLGLGFGVIGGAATGGDEHFAEHGLRVGEAGFGGAGDPGAGFGGIGGDAAAFGEEAAVPELGFDHALGDAVEPFGGFDVVALHADALGIEIVS